MSSFFDCVAYDDVESKILLNDNVVFLTLKVKANNTDVHITLNPLQARMLVKYLTVALTKIDFVALKDEKYFGDLSVQIEEENPAKIDTCDEFYENSLMYEDEYSVAVPF